MGIQGLKGFIEQNKDFLLNHTELHHCKLIIDGNNLVSALHQPSQARERRDLFGSDLVLFAQYLITFLDKLKQCNIEPILVFDGAQTAKGGRDKTQTKLKRCKERFLNVMKVNNSGWGNVIVPSISAMITKSIACDRNITIVQAMHEADDEIARMAHIHKCPVLSNDSDFYLFNLPDGVIPFDLLQHQVNLPTGKSKGGLVYKYMACNMYKQSNFLKRFPDLDVRCLPLLGILAGNDFVDQIEFSKVCSQLPNFRLKELRGFGQNYHSNQYHEKILKILYFLCGKNLNQNMRQISDKLPSERRQYYRTLMKEGIRAYKVPTTDHFFIELMDMCREGFFDTYGRYFESVEEMEGLFKSRMEILCNWLKNATEHSVMMRRALEIMHRNVLFVRPSMDDLQLPSSHLCQKRCFEVILQLTRVAFDDNRPCSIYDRIDTKYEHSFIYPVHRLEKFGQLRFLIYDIPSLPEEKRRAILLATFHYSIEEFKTNLEHYLKWFDKTVAHDLLIIKLLLNFIDLESVKLFKPFRRATLLCYIYYLDKRNRSLLSWRDNRTTVRSVKEGLRLLRENVERRRFTKVPRNYEARISHQISQLQTAIYSFNLLNAFLGCPTALVKSENWLNSCLIFNLSTELKGMKKLQTNLSPLVGILS